jgi:nicotinate phosphoribosyltransferase
MQVDTESYVARVQSQARALVDTVGDPQRIFEVGLRAATCLEQHVLALEALKVVGINRTSHVYGAVKKGMVAVGTMGHEHVQRYGSDVAAFSAMVDRRPQRSSFLLDTFDTIRSGLPAALALISQRPQSNDSIRYDSGDKAVQLRHAVAESRRLGVSPVHILEDGFDLALTQQFETLRQELGVPADKVVYGYGGYLVAKPAGGLTRDRVAAVYKLSRTGALPVMKFGDEAGEGKRSVPGEPVVFRRGAGASGPFGLIGQAGESAPPGYQLLTGSPAVALMSVPDEKAPTVALSPASQVLVEECTRRRHA